MTDAATRTAEIVHEEHFPHPPAVVWRALTEADLISRWLMKTDFQPVQGRAFTLSMTVPPDSAWDGIVNSEVLEIEPERRLVITWNSGGLDTTVTYTLTPTDAGTRLKMVHAGFDPVAHPQAFHGAAYGWKHNLGRLNGLLAEIA